MVWDIATGVPVISLEDPVQVAAGSRSSPGKGGAVKGLAWVMANPARLAIVLSGGVVLVWDVQGESLGFPNASMSASRYPCEGEPH